MSTNRRTEIILIALCVVGSLACDASRQIEFRHLADTECVGCQSIQWRAGSGNESLIYSDDPRLTVDEGDVVGAVLWPSRRGTWSLSLQLDAPTRSRWTEFISEAEPGFVALVEGVPVAVLHHAMPERVVFSDIPNLHEAERLLSLTGLEAKATRIGLAQAEAAESTFQRQNPKLHSVLQESDDLIRELEVDEERWSELDRLLGEDRPDQEAIKEELKRIRSSEVGQ